MTRKSLIARENKRMKTVANMQPKELNSRKLSLI